MVESHSKLNPLKGVLESKNVTCSFYRLNFLLNVMNDCHSFLILKNKITQNYFNNLNISEKQKKIK